MTWTLLAVIGLIVSTPSAGIQQPTSSPSLDFEFFKTRVQPMFTTKRPGNARCVSCHAFGTPMQLQPLPPDSGTWNDEQSRKNFDVIRLRVVPGNPEASRLLRHPLAESAGGDPHHDGANTGLRKTTPNGRRLRHGSEARRCILRRLSAARSESFKPIAPATTCISSTR